MRVLSKEIIEKEGREIELAGWVAGRRDHGKIIFIDLRDRGGIVQLVFTPKKQEVYDIANTLRSEWVIRVWGKVSVRPEGMENNELPTGKLEISVDRLEIIAQAKTPPFDLDTDGREINEEIRMKYRYLDLRRPRMQKNIHNRHKVIKSIRDFLDKKEFIEIETPILTKSTPEGARDYLVPSRIYPGKFYALPQSPQQYKQILMASGIEKYFQIARCFRDEDSRGDRQPEFTQLDLEMSFVEREDVMRLNEELLIEIIEKLYPEKKIQEIPFPRLSYKEAMGKYGTDRPDLRNDKDDPDILSFCWVVDFPFFEKVDNTRSGISTQEWTFTHNPFSAPKPEFMEDLMEGKNIPDILTSQYDIVLNGWEIGGGSIRNHKPDALKKVLGIIGVEPDKIQSNFGHMLEALSSGTPSHGGIAWGLDRFMMILENEPNIRENIAFPKMGDGKDLMMDSPSNIPKKQLEELHIKISGEPSLSKVSRRADQSVKKKQK